MSKKNKFSILLFIVLIISALIGGISISVYSSIEDKTVIKFDDNNVWQCKNKFNCDWYINTKLNKKISFKVDLSGYLISDNDAKANLDAPFTIKVSNGQKNSNSIEDITDESKVQVSKVSEKPGIFDVTFEVIDNYTYGDFIKLDVNFNEENKWNIKSRCESFNLNIDDIAPTFKLGEYQKVTADTVKLNCDFDEENIDKVIVTGTIQESCNAEPKIIKDELLGNNNVTSGEFSSIILDKKGKKFELDFNTLGGYDINIALYDKAGNKHEVSGVKFDKVPSNADVKLINAIQNEQKYYVSGKTLNISAEWNFFVKESIEYQILKENTDNNVGVNIINASNGSITVPQDGAYDLKLGIHRWRRFGENSYEEKKYKMTFDSQNPTLSIKANGDEIGFNECGQVYFQNEKDIKISLMDINIDKTKRKIEVYKEADSLKSTTDDSLEFKADDEGLYVVKVYAEDYAGNKTEGTYFIYIDKQAPTVDINGVYDGLKIKSGSDEQTPVITVKAFDDNFKNGKVIITRNSKNEQLEKIEEPLNNGEEYKYEVNKNGKYTVTAFATDKSGRSTVIDTVKFERDIDSPELNIKVDDRELEDGEFDKDNIPYIKNANGIKIEATINEDYPKLDDDGAVDKKATYMKIVRAPIDKNGEISETQESVQYFTDSKSININDDGKYEVTIYTVDDCENENEKTLYFVLDRMAPELIVTGVKNYYNSNVDIQIESKDPFQEGGSISITYTKIVKHLDKEDEVFADNVKCIELDSNDVKINLSDLDEFNEQADYKISSLKVVDKAGNESEKKDINFTFDTDAPTKVIDGIDDEKLYYNSDRNITINTEDIDLDTVKVTIYKDGEEYEPTPEETIQAFTIEERKAYASYVFCSEGEYKICLESIDKSGNGADDVLEKEFIIDKTVPVINIEDYDSLNGTYINYDKSLKVSVEEKYLEQDIECSYVNVVKKYPDGTVENNNYVFELNGECPDYSNIYDKFTEDAEYTVTVTAQDKAGNVSVSPSITFVVDKTVPVQSITGVENDAYYNIDKDVEFLSIDNNQDINTISVTRDGEEYHVGEFAIEGIKVILNNTFSAEGTYEIVFTTTDKAGNTVVSRIKFTIDKTAPDIKAIKGDDGSELKSGEYINRIFTPQFILDNSEDFITQVTLNGTDVTGNISIASQEMEYNYTVTAQDKAGNIANMDLLFTVDTTNPEISISDIMSGFFNQDLTPKFEITDINLDYANTSSTLNEQQFTSGTKIEEQNDFNLKLIGTDLATNSNSQSISFTIDKEGPVISFKNPISGKYFTEDFIPEFLIKDLSDYTIITLTLDGEEYHIGDYIEEEGKHVLYIEVMDKAGNISELSVEFILDKTAPKFIIDGVADGETYYDAMSATVMLDNPLDTINTITVNGEAADGETSEEFGQQMIKLDFNNIDDYEVMLKGTDEAGNSTVQTIKFTVAEKTLLSKITTNKKLLYSSLATVVAVLFITITSFGLKRRKKLKLKSTEDLEQ